jgi:hypothetical protein
VNGEQLARWTARLALLLYAATLLLRYVSPPRPRLARGLWTAGCFVFIAHVALAFHYFHHWSHAKAYRETARQTGEMFGTPWGGGLYLNYLFTLAWMADVGWWWRRGVEGYHRRPQWVGVSVDAFMFFMAFNSTVVFAHGATRWVGVAIVVLLAAPALRVHSQRRT